jgi:prepilin-type N-terminal cleavage/methylation domain-containing protein/prepilin-type processing-associated H-X9-DG protein
MRRAFTLRELLVVIAIIGILAPILTCARHSAMTESKKSACAANLHCLGLQWALYLDDSNGHYPGDPGLGPDEMNDSHAKCLGALLWSYNDTLEALKCPARKSAVTTATFTASTGQTKTTVSGSDYAMDVSIPQSADPARATMADSSVAAHPKGPNMKGPNMKGSNILFIDTHVRWAFANTAKGQTSWVANPDMPLADTDIYQYGTPAGQTIPAPGNGVDPVTTRNDVDAWISRAR